MENDELVFIPLVKAKNLFVKTYSCFPYEFKLILFSVNILLKYLEILKNLLLCFEIIKQIVLYYNIIESFEKALEVFKAHLLRLKENLFQKRPINYVGYLNRVFLYNCLLCLFF